MHDAQKKKNPMKQIPNIVTGIRIILSLTLLFIEPLSVAFILIYLLAGISDMLDGVLARKMHVTSKLGALLDSVADATLIFVLLAIIIPYFIWPAWVICWIALIVIIRLSSLLIGFFKYRAFAFLHTYANKITGLALFCFPLLYWLWGLNVMAIVLCCLATISAIEELLINATSNTLNRDITSIFAVSQNQK